MRIGLAIALSLLILGCTNQGPRKVSRPDDTTFLRGFGGTVPPHCREKKPPSAWEKFWSGLTGRDKKTPDQQRTGLSPEMLDLLKKMHKPQVQDVPAAPSVSRIPADKSRKK